MFVGQQFEGDVFADIQGTVQCSTEKNDLMLCAEGNMMFLQAV